MKKNKEWFKQQLCKYYPSQGEIDNPDYEVIAKVEIIDRAFSLINQMDEPEKAVIPEFASYFIKSFDDPIYEMVVFLEHYASNGLDKREEITEEQVQWFSNNIETFYEACVNDYTVEKPKLLTVTIKNEGNETIVSKQVTMNEVNNIMELF